MSCYLKKSIITGLFAVTCLLFVQIDPVTAEEQKENKSVTEPVEDPTKKDASVEPENEYSNEVSVEDIVVGTHSQIYGEIGYRFFSFDGYGGRAAQYEDAHSGPVFSTIYNSLGKDHKFSIEGTFLTDRDYHADLTYDYMGRYRFQLRTESLFHNLDHLQISAPASINLSDQNQSDRYGLRVEQDLASFRARIGDYPAHINLNYWRLVRDGSSQLRFSDHVFNPPAPETNTIYSISNPASRETHEGKISFDSHFGPLNFAYDLTIRQFTDHNGPPATNFEARADPLLSFTRSAGLLEHNENPDSRFISHTIKVHTEQTGGIIAAASYSYAQRTNLSSLIDVKGVNGLNATLQTAAGDFLYTPCKEFSFAIKYRHQEIDRDSPANLVYAPATPSSMSVLPAIDTVKDIITTTLSFRPVNNYTLKGEYKGSFIHRDNVDSWNRAAVVSSMPIPSDTDIHKGTITLYGRPVKGLRLKALYSYTATESPEFGTNSEEKHYGQFLLTYSLKDRWGATAGYQYTKENSNSNNINSLSLPPLFPVSQNYVLPRERRSSNATAGIWTTLFGRLTLSGSLGLLYTNTDQEVIFTSTSNLSGNNVASNYTSQAILYSFNALYNPVERLSLSLMFQQIRSFAEFDPVNITAPVDTSGVKDISRIKSVENTVGFRTDYQFLKNINCGVTYTYRDYTDQYNSSFDGSVHSILAVFSAKW